MKRKIPKIIRTLIGLAAFVILCIPFVYGMTNIKSIYKYVRISQIGPDILSLAGSFAWATFFALLTLLLLTFVFGRFYCSTLCPFGILQDIIYSFKFHKTMPASNHPLLRCGIAAAALGALVFGWAIFFRVFDPYSIFGRIVSGTAYPIRSAITSAVAPEAAINGSWEMISAIIYGVVPLLLVIALVMWKKRIYCTSICPVGTILGLCSKHGLLKLQIAKDKCVSCGMCIKDCPADCIDTKSKTLDNERCLRCLNCISSCRMNAIRMTPARQVNKCGVSGISESRRGFLLGITAAAFAAGSLTNILRPSAKDVKKTCVVPPGAGSMSRFLARCTGCGLCATNCNGKVIRMPSSAIPYIHLDFTKGMCEYECHRCTTVCTTSALTFLSKDLKKVTRIGLAVFDPTACIAFQDGTACGACAEHCPTGALRMEIKDGATVPIPVLNTDLCIGCGSCEYACPVKTITVDGVDVQVRVESPDEYFRSHPPHETSASQDESKWLI